MAQITFYEFIESLQRAPISPMQTLEVCAAVLKYMQALEQFHSSTTPESEALARWRMSDLELEYNLLRQRLQGSIPRLGDFRKSIY